MAVSPSFGELFIKFLPRRYDELMNSFKNFYFMNKTLTFLAKKVSYRNEVEILNSIEKKIAYE